MSAAVAATPEGKFSPVPPQGTPRESRALLSADESRNLPALRSSEKIVDRSKPLPTSLQSDFLPEDVLFALTQPPSIKDQLGPPSRFRNLNTSSTNARAPPASLWNHKRKERFKHLTEQTPCICGAGKDISFLYDVPNKEKSLDRPEKIDKSVVRREAADHKSKSLQLPDTLLPEEYHIVKNKGVMGIEFHEDKYSTQVQDHEKHLVVFPSMNPASRSEVIQLKKTLMDMLERSGVNDSDVEIKGPTQMHNLLELIKKEQNIYNIIFHELIRQTSIECVERGELLADLRLKYNELLNKVPQQIRSLHEEVMAQRALDRRLTEELMRFKTTISSLTNELSEVKEHDRKVTREAQQAQEDLKAALSEAEKNASLLAEYHDLYELQRNRLETQVHMLTEERELWSGAAYCLALKVTEEANLITAKKLHVNEKSWAKLATHFTILLSDKDTELLTRLQEFVEKWRDLVEEFNMIVKHREEEMKKNIAPIRPSVDKWMKIIRNYCFTKEGQFVKAPDEDKMRELLTDIRIWEEVLGKESEKFGGDTLLNGQEQLMLIRKQMDGWTDNALKVFTRHRKDGQKSHPDQENMLLLNEEVEELLHQFSNRITGENGVAPHSIHLLNSLETWDMKLASSLNGTMAINDNEWGTLCQLMEEWLGSVDHVLEYVGTTQRDEERAEKKNHIRIDVMDSVRKVQKWATTATNAIDSEDAKLVEQVSTLHSQMVQWMVQMLLRLAPDWKENSQESKDMALRGSLSLNQLHTNVKTLFEQLESFSNYVALAVGNTLYNITNLKILQSVVDDHVTDLQQCCSGIVMDNTQQRRDNMEDNADHELRDLQRLRTECEGWINTAKILTVQLLEEPMESLFPAPVQTEERSSRERALSTLSVDADISYHDKEKIEKPTESDKAEAPPESAAEPQELQKEEEKSEEKEQKPVEPPEPAPPAQTEESPSQQPEDENVPAPAERIVTGERLEVIGQDENTHVTRLEDNPEIAPPSADTVSQPAPPTSEQTEGAPDTQKAFEALEAVSSLQDQLLHTEQRAQAAEERASFAEAELTSSQEKIRELEKRLQKLEVEAAKDDGKSPGPASKVTSPVVPPVSPSKEPAKDKESKRPESQASKASSTKSTKSKKK